MPKSGSLTGGGVKQATSKKGALTCGEVGTYRGMKKRKTNKQNRDHVPATSSMLAAGAKSKHAKGLKGARLKCYKKFIKMDAQTIAIPYGIHKKYSRTYGGKGGQTRINEDVKNLKKAAEDDFAKVEPKLSADCKKKYNEAKKKILAQLPDKFFKECRDKAMKC